MNRMGTDILLLIFWGLLFVAERFKFELAKRIYLKILLIQYDCLEI